ncbi:MAG: Flp family type IVb pilin [Pseudolabrys sp.]
MSIVRSFLTDQKGNIAIEYAVIVAMVSGLVIATVNNVGAKLAFQLAAAGRMTIVGAPSH